LELIPHLKIGGWRKMALRYGTNRFAKSWGIPKFKIVQTLYSEARTHPEKPAL